MEEKRYRIWLSVSPQFGKVIETWSRRAGVKPQDFCTIVVKRYGKEMAVALGVWKEGEELPNAVTLGSDGDDK